MAGHPARNLPVRCAVSHSGEATCETSQRGSPTAIISAMLLTAKSSRPSTPEGVVMSLELMTILDGLATSLLSGSKKYARSAGPDRLATALQVNPSSSTYCAYGEFIAEEIEKWGKVILGRASSASPR
jgi:hypothetical protein